MGDAGPRGTRQYGRWQKPALVTLRPVFRTLWRIHTVGLEHIPQSGPAIICPNHVSVIDSFMLPAVLPRRITYVGKSEYLDDWKTAKLFPALGMIPIDRGGGDASQAALDTAARLLEAGELFGIYPEGTRSRSGNLHKGKTGPARLALRTGAPLVPVGLIGTREVQPPDVPVPRCFLPVEIRIGRPIDVRRYRGRDEDRTVLRRITDELMFEIAELSGQTYVDEYASKPAPADGPSSAQVLAQAAA